MKCDVEGHNWCYDSQASTGHIYCHDCGHVATSDELEIIALEDMRS